MMKKRKIKYAALMLILLICSGCSAKRPSDDTLKSDLATSLQEKYYALTIDECEINQSKTEDSIFGATIFVTAHSESGYAKVYLTAYVEYDKYDQGWVFENCEWTLDSCEVLKWPDEDEMEMYLADRASEVEDYLQYPEYSSLSNDGQATLIYEGTIDAEYEGFVGVKGSIVSYWTYDAVNDTFEFDEDESDVYLTLTHNIEGKWKDERMSGDGVYFDNYYFIITNQTEDSFTIEYTYNDLKDTVSISTDFETFKETGELSFTSSFPTRI